MAAVQETVVETTYVKPIDAAGLAAFAEKGRNNPDSKGTVKSRTVYDGQFRSLTHVGHHTPVVVDEPLHLFGQDTAPAPSEILLSALGGCLCVGIHAVATHKGVKIRSMEVLLEGDIGNPSAWGAGGAKKAPAQMGFQAVRAKILLDADAPREVLEAIVKEADYASPMANCYRNPIPTEVVLG
jgi:organic hydroperoxide reductase OsmC/OhrA